MRRAQRERDPVTLLADEEMAGELPNVDTEWIEATGDELHERCASPTARKLALASRCLVIEEPDLPAGVHGLLVGHRILVRPRREARAKELVILHELAHWLLRKKSHSHADVWLLTLALAIPQSLMKQLEREGCITPEEIYPRVRVSWWAVLKRLEVRRATIAAMPGEFQTAW